MLGPTPTYRYDKVTLEVITQKTLLGFSASGDEKKVPQEAKDIMASLYVRSILQPQEDNKKYPARTSLCTNFFDKTQAILYEENKQGARGLVSCRTLNHSIYFSIMAQVSYECYRTQSIYTWYIQCKARSTCDDLKEHSQSSFFKVCWPHVMLACHIYI